MNCNESIDYLTGLLNRMGLFNIFDNLDENSNVQVLFFDVDNFKTVNDMYGHEEGDHTLIHFADLLRECSPKNAIISRLGGDEFVVIIPSEMSRNELTAISDKFLARRNELKTTYSSFEIISPSIGIMHNYSVINGLGLALSMADKALYFAKERGRNNYVFYEDFSEIIDKETRIESGAAIALAQGRFKVLYQPVIHLHSSKLIRSEANCVWEQENGEVWGSSVFRAIFEKNGFIKELDIHIFEQVCRDQKLLKESGRKDIIGVQLSPLLIMEDSFLDRLETIMSKYDVEPGDFEINIDEKIYGGRVAIDRLVQNMNRLNSRGFLISLSHFGADFSSVRYLKELPIASVKLDEGFIKDNLSDDKGIGVLNSIVKVGKGFKFTVIASEVNDISSALSLTNCGCDAASGDYFSKKLPIDKYLDYLLNDLKEAEGTFSYHFKNNLLDEVGVRGGSIVGSDITFTDGITPEWGALSFPGGVVRTNYVKLPTSLLEYGSYTISMWIKPAELQNWVSAIYTRYQNGFSSFMPNIAGGRCMFRINEDAHMDVWHDVMTSSINTDRWTYVSFSYNSLTEIVRLFINGEFMGLITNVPLLHDPMEVRLGGDDFQISYCGLISALQIDIGALEDDVIANRYQAFLDDGADISPDKKATSGRTEIITHDPAIFEDPDSHKFYIYATGAEGLESGDLLHWKKLGKVVDKPLDEAIEWTNSEAIWAPDIVKVGDEYRLYCSNSSWGVQQSCIFLAVSDKPQGPFIPKAAVLKTDNQNIVNGIDANIIEDHKTHAQYLLYGSFWGGIHMIELDKETGLAKENQGIGTLVANRPLWNNCAIEGPYMIYHPETDYYYLFVSYGSLMEDYNIRVGRSRNITGPFVDFHGKPMISAEDTDCSTGLMISCGYHWLSGQPYMGPGHNSVLLRENGEMFLVSHIRKLSFNADPGPGLLQIRKMIMTPDGWPIALGQPYNAETLLDVRNELIPGEYERIELRPSIPQGVQYAHPMRLFENGKLEMASVMGTWRRIGTFELELKYGPITEYVHLEKGLDHETNKTTIVMGGLNSLGICTWAKKEALNYQCV